MDEKNQIRVRIAPSPTGDPHVGTAYVALFNYVFAKKNGGKFILRIEDTDQLRARPSSEAMIIEGLTWLGLNWHEGPDKGGDHAPYRQSERSHIYREYSEILLRNGSAYRCFCEHKRLEELRDSQKQQGLTTKYDRHCLSLSPSEVAGNMERGVPFVIRMKMPDDGTTKFFDELRGQIEINNEQLDDQVLMKSDGLPTYHLANVVDDHLMEISHVIRAEEWISSTPKHVLLYKAFGWKEPKWVHLPLLRNADKSKISKRKNPISIMFYKRIGILPKALLNYLALMGWNIGNDREIFSLEEMIDAFDFKDVSLGGPVFDQAKLSWVNQQYMHKMSEDEFCEYIREEIFSVKNLKKLKPLALERMSRFDQFVGNNTFFFSGSVDFSLLPVVPKSKQKVDVRNMLELLLENFDDLYDWDVQNIKDCLEKVRSELQWKPKDFFMTIRFIATGRKDSPPLDETLVVLGRDIVRYRLREALCSDTLRD
ncbi:MAG: glutamate--tRNA ligase [Oligoflexales bacterium]|nr:glutamate--tRNA ligase [Oligoflexales bacterium]